MSAAAGFHRSKPNELRDRQGARGCANEGNSDASVGHSESAARADLAFKRSIRFSSKKPILRCPVLRRVPEPFDRPAVRDYADLDSLEVARTMPDARVDHVVETRPGQQLARRQIV